MFTVFFSNCLDSAYNYNLGNPYIWYHFAETHVAKVATKETFQNVFTFWYYYNYCGDFFFFLPSDSDEECNLYSDFCLWYAYT